MRQNSAAVVSGRVIGVGQPIELPDTALNTGGRYTPIDVQVLSVLAGDAPFWLTVFVPGEVGVDGVADAVGPIASSGVSANGAILFLVLVDGRYFVHGGGGFFWESGSHNFRNRFDVGDGGLAEAYLLDQLGAVTCPSSGGSGSASPDAGAGASALDGGV
jgi:hypothetical protein